MKNGGTSTGDSCGSLTFSADIAASLCERALIVASLIPWLCLLYLVSFLGRMSCSPGNTTTDDE